MLSEPKCSWPRCACRYQAKSCIFSRGGNLSKPATWSTSSVSFILCCRAFLGLRQPELVDGILSCLGRLEVLLVLELAERLREVIDVGRPTQMTIAGVNVSLVDNLYVAMIVQPCRDCQVALMVALERTDR